MPVTVRAGLLHLHLTQIRTQALVQILTGTAVKTGLPFCTDRELHTASNEWGRASELKSRMLTRRADRGLSSAGNTEAAAQKANPSSSIKVLPVSSTPALEELNTLDRDTQGILRKGSYNFARCASSPVERSLSARCSSSPVACARRQRRCMRDSGHDSSQALR